MREEASPASSPRVCHRVRANPKCPSEPSASSECVRVAFLPGQKPEAATEWARSTWGARGGLSGMALISLPRS